MFYKPKYCCNCGEKIERVKWNLTASRRFCQLCETEFYSQEWSPRIAVALGLILGIVGIGGYFQKSEKPLKIAAGSLSKSSPLKKESSNQMPNVSAAAISNVQASAQSPANSVEARRGQMLVSSPPAKNAQPGAAQKQPNSDETVYFCGAATKKSTACSRRVKGGGRCFQHVGQPPILPPEKLIASR